MHIPWHCRFGHEHHHALTMERWMFPFPEHRLTVPIAGGGCVLQNVLRAPINSKIVIARPGSDLHGTLTLSCRPWASRELQQDDESNRILEISRVWGTELRETLECTLHFRSIRSLPLAAHAFNIRKLWQEFLNAEGKSNVSYCRIMDHERHNER